MSIAKGLGGGYVPLGAVVYQDRISQAIMEEHGAVAIGHTFAGHTLACAGGAAVQRIIERDNLIARVAEEGTWLRETLQAELGQNPHVGDVRGRGFFIGVEFVKDAETKQPFDASVQLFAKLQAQAFDNGLICYPVGGNVDGVNGDIAIISPPYNTSRAELEEIVEKFVRSADQVVRSVTAN
jgi:adenosylmethionine-8-amino-7-oxononanoate aminotransferase